MDKLVSTEWLAARIGADDVIILDATMHLPDSCRDALAEFGQRHIPGARYLDLATLTDPASSVPKAVPTAEQFADRMRELGVAHGARIVLYDDSDIRSAARAWFLFDHAGEPNVAVLDGGLAKWIAEGREVEEGNPAHAPRDYPEQHMRRDVRGKQDILDAIENGEAQLVDARDAARFAGEEGSGSEGHIPGAVNVHFSRLLNEDGTYRSADEIGGIFESAGVDLDKPVITSCNSGMTACVLLFALEVAGKDNVALYDGSWMEWGADPDTPKAKGSAG
ncbi:sulfurtransferase [Qipengyuania aquimaris]|uniref:sulfurtransferase n=1 Tax=Qipengyuania aquimaris TaxID=255984 RepID=UPI001CD52E43|nr:sulfurtransferase [Qipengyuania aquimaris]MCA0904078.1 sulfurtransferase [Qipengyuania aquimaris]